MPWPEVETLVRRIDDLLVADDPGANSPLLGAWEDLAHQRRGTERVRIHQQSRFTSAAESEARVRRDYRARFAIELLQNANDACAAAGETGHVWFQVTETALLVGNGGAAFGPANIESLIHLGASTKEASRGQTTIGYKGIGFSSVFEITDTPQIISPPYRFGFHGEATAALISRTLRLPIDKVPARGFPFPLEPPDWGEDAAAVDAMFAAGAVTVIRLPLRSDETRGRLREDIEVTLVPEVLLFMPALSGMTLMGDDEVAWTVEGEESHDLGTLKRIDGPDPREWLVIDGAAMVDQSTTLALDDDMWAGVTEVNLALAIPWKDGAPDPTRGYQPVHVYFPTDEKLGRRFIVHADFYVDSSRRHIDHQHGASAELNSALIDAVANLVGQTVEALAVHGNALLRVIAPSHTESSGFGEKLGERIDEVLRETPFLRPADGGAHRRPSEMFVVTTELDQTDEARLIDLIGDRSDVLHAGDRADVDRYVFEELGCDVLTGTSIAEYLVPRQAGQPYEEVLDLIRRWYETVGTESLAAELREVPIVQDENGNWRAPENVIRATSGLPPLPKRIRPVTLRQPNTSELDDFVTSVLEISRLGAGTAVSKLLRAISMKDFGLDANERREAIEFLHSIWKIEPDAVKSGHDWSVVRLPASSVGDDTDIDWRPPNTVYFGEDFSPGGISERIYAPLGEAEFLRWDSSDQDRAEWRDFFSVLGVAETPRNVPIPSDDFVPGWRILPQVHDAWCCVKGRKVHPQSGRRPFGDMVDRIDRVLDRGEPTSLLALVEHLASLEKPFGEDTYIECQHGSHASQRRPHGNRTIGYQDWLLHHFGWIPTSGPEDLFGRPDTAWRGVPDKYQEVLPIAAVDDKTAAQFNCARWSSPRRSAIEATLQLLEERFPDLQEAPDAVDEAAVQLLARLRGGKDEERGAETIDVPLPSRLLGRPCWSREPLIPDLPGLDAFSVPVLASRKVSRAVARRYGLKFASGVAQAKPDGERVDQEVPPTELPIPDPVGLVAVVRNMGRDLDRTAGRVACLEQTPMRTLEVAVTLGDETNLLRRTHHLSVKADDEVRTGRLFFVLGAFGIFDCADDLAAYLGVEGNEDSLVAFLQDPGGYLVHNEIREEQLQEARDALERRGSPYINERGPTSSDSETVRSESSSTTSVTTSTATDMGERLGVATPSEASDGAIRPSEDRPEPTVVETATAPAVDPRGASGGTVPPSARTGTAPSPAPPPEDLEPIDYSALVFTEQAVPAGGTKPRTSRERGPSSPPDSAGARPNRDHGERGTPASRKRTEEAAIRVFTRFAESEWGAVVTSVEDENKGWDLEVDVNGELTFIEVKGLSANNSQVILTKNELDKARKTRNYWVAVVDSVGGQAGAISLIPGGAIPDGGDVLVALQWELSGWPLLAEKSFDWNSDGP